MIAQNKALTWSGRAISGLVCLMLVFSGSMKIKGPPELTEQFVGKFGYPADLALALGIVEISCAVIDFIPQTAVLGAVLLTGYLGGAVATHVRIHDNFLGAAIGGVLVGLGLYL